MIAVTPLVVLVGVDPVVRRLLVSAFSSSGFRSLQIDSYESGASRADIVVFDVGADLRRGVLRTQALRASTRCPLLAIGGSARDEDKAAVLDAGANDYLVTPIAWRELVARVRVWLRHSSREGAAALSRTLSLRDERVRGARRTRQLRATRG